MLYGRTRKLLAASMLLTMTLFVNACVTDGPKTDTFCLTEKPHYFTKQEAQTMPIAQLRDTLKRNEYGAKRCGWGAAGKAGAYWGGLSRYLGSATN